MIEAIEHDYDLVSVPDDDLIAVLESRGGIDGWNLVAAVEERSGYLRLFWSRKSPAIPNTTPSQTLSKEFTP